MLSLSPRLPLHLCQMMRRKKAITFKADSRTHGSKTSCQKHGVSGDKVLTILHSSWKPIKATIAYDIIS
jgi:hypothetical protein